MFKQIVQNLEAGPLQPAATNEIQRLSDLSAYCKDLSHTPELLGLELGEHHQHTVTSTGSPEISE